MSRAMQPIAPKWSSSRLLMKFTFLPCLLATVVSRHKWAWGERPVCLQAGEVDSRERDTLHNPKLHGLGPAPFLPHVPAPLSAPLPGDHMVTCPGAKKPGFNSASVTDSLPLGGLTYPGPSPWPSFVPSCKVTCTSEDRGEACGRRGAVRVAGLTARAEEFGVLIVHASAHLAHQQTRGPLAGGPQPLVFGGQNGH